MTVLKLLWCRLFGHRWVRFAYEYMGLRSYSRCVRCDEMYGSIKTRRVK